MLANSRKIQRTLTDYWAVNCRKKLRLYGVVSREVALERNEEVCWKNEKSIYENFFDSLSDEEFVAMLLECGIERTKRASESDYVKVFCSDEKKIRGKKCHIGVLYMVQ